MRSRISRPRLDEALEDSPVVLLHGPRQSGKSTLVKQVGDERGYAYFTFDDDAVRTAAELDPAGFVGDLPQHVILDEVQRVPEIFVALKSAVDRDRRPGRFLLTGSANVLFLPHISDSLAGRMEVVRLFPFAQCEIEQNEPRFLDDLFDARIVVQKTERLGEALAARVCTGGFPPAVARTAPRRQAAWLRDYATAIIQRDVRDLADISSLDALGRLLELAAGQTAHLVNIAELAAPFHLTRPTIRNYVTLLDRMFMLEELQPWHSNRLKRLIKTPKLHFGDTGLAAALLGLDAEALYADREMYGQLLETFVYQQIRSLAAAHEADHRLFHFRHKDGYEVDVVLQRGNKLAGIEVKAAATVHDSDFRGLRHLAASVGGRFVAGVILYDGETALPFGDRMFAVPIRFLWENFAE